MKGMVSVLLTYRNEDRVEYQLYAEFLRLAGIYVCEDCRVNPKEESSQWNVEEFSARCTISEQQSNLKTIANKLNWLKDVLVSQLSASNFYDAYSDIAAIYEKHSLLQASVTLQYYRTKVTKGNAWTEIKRAGDSFEAAADDFVGLVSKKQHYMENQYLRYAKLYCKQKANLARYLCDEPVVYYVNDLGAEGMALLQKFPEFSNAWVLIGFVYEISASYARDAIEAFQKAIQLEGPRPYVSSIYYWLGKRCEDHENFREQAYDFYRRAYDLMPKYRNIYKMASRYMQKQAWNDAILFYQNCLSSLEVRGSYQDPLEQEYCFKVNIHICYCFMQQCDYVSAVSYGTKALELKKELMSEELLNPRRKFYIDMFKKSMNKYLNISLERMREQQVNTYLAKAYQELNDAEASNYYLKKAISG